MNNLLRTISAGPLKASLPEADLKLLLSSVRDVRSQDAKAAESFYGSLEGVLLELRTVTADNRDAEAFLKPVSRSEYPDYYEVIKHPMDLGTMLKNVKNRKYKSKQEFASDLNLIWKNCFKYNSGPEHVLRGCVTRLKRKADHLLAHLSDRPDRVTINGLHTPSAPNSLSSRESLFKPIKINGIINGTIAHDNMPTPDASTPQANMTPTPGSSTSHSRPKSPQSARGSPAKPFASSAIPFEDQPALTRTSGCMELFSELDCELQSVLDGASDEAGTLPLLGFDAKGKGKETLLQRLRNLVDDYAGEEEVRTPDDDEDAANKRLKRKRSSSAQDQRKRPRFTDPLATLGEGCAVAEEDLLETWWEAAQSSTLLVGGFPTLPQYDDIVDGKENIGKWPRLTTYPPGLHGTRKRIKRKRVSSLLRQSKPAQSLLKLMNHNISILARVRQTHSKFVALNAASDSTNPVALEPVIEPEVDRQVLDDEGWRVQGEVGQEAANDCLSWMGSKVLQHVGFQGSSQTALGVLTSVAEEYLQNVGRTIRFMCDKYSNTMTSEEIILHTLFESGTTEIQDLERYIKDDVIRYGGRLGELEKKLVGAYREITSVEIPSEEGMFDEGDDDNFVTGLADILGSGEDFLGLRELGIEAEFGLKSLAVPKRLWKGKSSAEDHAAPNRANPGEPPPPFPPPPPFIPLDSSKLDSQIGLLRNFYQERFTALAASNSSSLPQDLSAIGSIPPIPMSTNPTVSPSTLPPSSFTLPLLTSSAPIVLPDDPPNPTRAKIGPLGQVIVINPSSAANKKKGKAKETTVDKGKDKDKDTEEAAGPKKKETKKKSKDDTKDNPTEVDGQTVGVDVNGTGPKKKLKSMGGKKPKNAKSTLEAPPAIIASA